MVSPKRQAWRCSNCGEEAATVDEFTAIDPRYQTGHCGQCSLRGKVPLVWATHDEMSALVAERTDMELRKKQIVALRVESIPMHPRTPGCCEGALAKREHLSVERLAQLRAIMYP